MVPFWMPNHPILSSHIRRHNLRVYRRSICSPHCCLRWFPQIYQRCTVTTNYFSLKCLNLWTSTDVDDSGCSCSLPTTSMSPSVATLYGLVCPSFSGVPYFFWLLYCFPGFFSRVLRVMPTLMGNHFIYCFGLVGCHPKCVSDMLVCDRSSRNKLHIITIHPSPRTNIDVLSMSRGSSCNRPQVPSAQLNGRLLPPSNCACYVVSWVVSFSRRAVVQCQLHDHSSYHVTGMHKFSSL